MTMVIIMSIKTTMTVTAMATTTTVVVVVVVVMMMMLAMLTTGSAWWRSSTGLETCWWTLDLTRRRVTTLSKGGTTPYR